jgi:hypothetical protein
MIHIFSFVLVHTIMIIKVPMISLFSCSHPRSIRIIRIDSIGAIVGLRVSILICWLMWLWY